MIWLLTVPSADYLVSKSVLHFYSVRKIRYSVKSVQHALSVLFAAGATKVRTLPGPPRRSRPGPPSSPATPARHHDTAGAGLALLVPPSKTLMSRTRDSRLS